MNVENDAPFITYLNNLDGFLKNDCISEGGFSTLHSVKVNLDDNLYCIKSFEFDCNDAAKRKIFSKHANKLYNINFPSLIPHKFFSLVDLDNQNHPSFIYPFFNNQSLKSNINKLNNTHIMIILIGISEGLRYLHQNNIVHGALEPSNILLDDQFRPILTSFGLSKMIKKINSIDPQIPNRGSFNYMPPYYIFQQVDDIKSDIYRFGLIVYFLLSRTDPYHECQKIIHIPIKIVSGSLPKIPEAVPSDFANFIYRCWSQVPQDRPVIQDVCREIAKLRLPNVDFDKISQYKDYLKKEAKNPFNEFKKIPFNEAKKPVIPEKRYTAQLNEKGLQAREKLLKDQKEREEMMMKQHKEREEQVRLAQLRIQQERLKEEEMRQEQLRLQQEKEEEMRQEQLRLQQVKEEEMRQEQLRLQKEKEEEEMRQEQLRLQQEKEEAMRQEQLRLQKEKEEEEMRQEQLRLQQVKQENDIHIQQEKTLPQAFTIHQPDDDEDYQNFQDEEKKQEDILNNLFKDNFTTNSTLLPYNSTLDDYENPPLPDPDPEPEPEPDLDQDYYASSQPNGSIKPRRTSSRIRKTRLNPFSESSSTPPSSSSQSSDDDGSDVSFTSRRTRSKRSPTKTSPSKSQPPSSSSSRSSRSSRSKSSKSRNSTRKKSGSVKSKKKSDEDYDDSSSDIDISMFQALTEEQYEDPMKMNYEDYSDEDESHIKDVLSIQKPKKKKRNNAKTDEEQYFANLNLNKDNQNIVKLAQGGDSECQNELGLALISNKGEFPYNPKMAFKFLDKAVKNNNKEAMINLGRCYEEGIGTAIDFTSAFELYKSAYEACDNSDEQVRFYAASQLGHCYEEGIGCPINKEMAVYYYKICLSENYIDANYPRCLLFGIGIEAKPEDAFKLINEFDENLDNNLILLKGICYEHGLGIDQNIDEAINCYSRAIDKGNKNAMINFALLLLSMGIVSKTKQKIPSNFQAISSFNYHLGSSQIDSNICFFDESFTDKNLPDPIDLLINASNLNKAKIHLADCYLRGVGVDIDFRAAIRNYSNASNRNNSEGSLRFNLYSSSPISIKCINQIKSAAAEGQNDLALVIYGRLLQKGIATDYLFKSNGGPDDEALYLFKIASDLKSPIGMCQYGKTLLMMQRRAKFLSKTKNTNYIVDPEIEKEALLLIKKSSQMKYKGGLYNYARCILESLKIIKIDNTNNNVILIRNDTKITDNIQHKIRIHLTYKQNDTNLQNDSNLLDDDDLKDDDISNIDMNRVREAFELLRMAADLGNNNARVLLGRLMKHGTFLNVDEKGALKYFDLARRSGSKNGVYYYSKMILDRSDEVNKETSTLLAELKSSINWEKTPVRSKAMNFYGRLLVHKRLGIRSDPNDFALYFKKASGYPFDEESIFDSSPNACINYGDCLMCGSGVEKDKSKGYQCYRRAFLLNKKEKFRMNNKSLYSFGVSLTKGDDKDEKIFGLELIKTAAERGEVRALLKCAKFLQGNGCKDVLVQNDFEAFKIYTFLIENDDNEVALLNAGKMLIEGRGTEKNDVLGRQLIEKAAEKKNEEAVQFLKKNV